MNTNYLIRPLLAATITCSFISCGEKWPCVNGSGDSVSEERTVSGFTGVSNELEGNVYILQASEFSVRIEAQQNVIDQIKTTISGDDLEISSERCINNSLPVNIYISMPLVNSLEVSGSGSLILQNKINTDDIDIDISGSGDFTTIDSVVASSIDMDISGSGSMNIIAKTTALSADISGSGDVTVKGTGTTFNADISGSGEIHAFDFTVLNASMGVSGSGNTELNASSTIDGHISGSGDLYYKGTPAINISVSGSGEIIHVD